MENGDKVPSTQINPNPRKYFGEDQTLNGRLRDIAISPDGTKIYLVNNGGTDRDKITVYTYTGTSDVKNNTIANLKLYPNPLKVGELLTVKTDVDIQEFSIYSTQGQLIQQSKGNSISTYGMSKGIYFVKVKTADNKVALTGRIELK